MPSSRKAPNPVALAGDGGHRQRLLAVEAQPLTRLMAGGPVAIMARLQRALLQQSFFSSAVRGRALDLLLFEGGGVCGLRSRARACCCLAARLSLVEVDGHARIGGKPELQLPIGGGLPCAPAPAGRGQYLPSGAGSNRRSRPSAPECRVQHGALSSTLSRAGFNLLRGTGSRSGDPPPDRPRSAGRTIRPGNRGRQGQGRDSRNDGVTAPAQPHEPDPAFGKNSPGLPIFLRSRTA